MSMRKQELITICAPIPPFVPRQLALDVLHNHSEVITLNPLVTGHRAVKPPRDAPSDEFHHKWYEITERIQYIPGLGKIGSSEISFNGSFQDTPWGLQTHIYAPMSVDMRAQYRVAGNQAGVEPRGKQDLALLSMGAPADGLFLRADIEFTSNVVLASFVRAQSKTAIKEMVDRMVKKAESMDSNILQRMIRSDRSPSQTPRTPPRTPPARQSPRLNTNIQLQSPPLNQTVMAQNIAYTTDRAVPIVPQANKQREFIAELPNTSAAFRQFVAELPATTKPTTIAELPTTNLDSPSSIHTPRSPYEQMNPYAELSGSETQSAQVQGPPKPPIPQIQIQSYPYTSVPQHSEPSPPKQTTPCLQSNPQIQQTSYMQSTTHRQPSPQRRPSPPRSYDLPESLMVGIKRYSAPSYAQNAGY